MPLKHGISGGAELSERTFFVRPNEPPVAISSRETVRHPKYLVEAHPSESETKEVMRDGRKVMEFKVTKNAATTWIPQMMKLGTIVMRGTIEKIEAKSKDLSTENPSDAVTIWLGGEFAQALNRSATEFVPVTGRVAAEAYNKCGFAAPQKVHAIYNVGTKEVMCLTEDVAESDQVFVGLGKDWDDCQV